LTRLGLEPGTEIGLGCTTKGDKTHLYIIEDVPIDNENA